MNASSLHRFSASCGAFTLVELLIVVAILLAIAAMMAPMYLHTRAESARSKCLDHLHAVGQGLTLYTYDYDDTLPMARYASGSPGMSKFKTDRPAHLLWADLVAPYVKGSATTFQCPSNVNSVAGVAPVPGISLSYALNEYFYNQPGVNRETETGGSLGEIPNAVSKILLAESAWENYAATIRPDQWRAPDGSAIWDRHGGRSNWIYGDLHAEVHSMPEAWKSIAVGEWRDPKKAGSLPYAQWFPWSNVTIQKW